MKVILWGLVVVALVYGAYSGMIAVWSWIAVNNAVDEIITKDGIEAVPAAEIKARVMKATNEAGIPLRENDVVVTLDERTVRVEAIWTVPVIIVKGESVLAIPLSVKRASAGSAAAPAGVGRR
ncbi:MAG TPA: hypothetical protein VN646_25540 [Candidatus Acidoferrum sp.]|jgi:hypothetical protein|nr:hypothetical protein [Candidatus Acidoferrum sp.]